MTYTIYYHRNKSNGKIYVGCTSQRLQNRFRKNGEGYFRGYKKLGEFQKDILKYGWDNFEHVILETCSEKSKAAELESKYIQKLNARKWGYNKTDGGFGTPGIIYDEKEIERRREYMKNRTVSEETRKKQSAAKGNYVPWNKGKKLTAKAS